MNACVYLRMYDVFRASTVAYKLEVSSTIKEAGAALYIRFFNSGYFNDMQLFMAP
jgi:hypothetical protein